MVCGKDNFVVKNMREANNIIIFLKSISYAHHDFGTHNNSLVNVVIEVSVGKPFSQWTAIKILLTVKRRNDFPSHHNLINRWQRHSLTVRSLRHATLVSHPVRVSSFLHVTWPLCAGGRRVVLWRFIFVIYMLYCVSVILDEATSIRREENCNLIIGKKKKPNLKEFLVVEINDTDKSQKFLLNRLTWHFCFFTASYRGRSNNSTKLEATNETSLAIHLSHTKFKRNYFPR